MTKWGRIRKTIEVTHGKQENLKICRPKAIVIVRMWPFLKAALRDLYRELVVLWANIVAMHFLADRPSKFGRQESFNNVYHRSDIFNIRKEHPKRGDNPGIL